MANKVEKAETAEMFNKQPTVAHHLQQKIIDGEIDRLKQLPGFKALDSINQANFVKSIRDNLVLDGFYTMPRNDALGRGHAVQLTTKMLNRNQKFRDWEDKIKSNALRDIGNEKKRAHRETKAHEKQATTDPDPSIKPPVTESYPGGWDERGQITPIERLKFMNTITGSHPKVGSFKKNIQEQAQMDKHLGRQSNLLKKNKILSRNKTGGKRKTRGKTRRKRRQKKTKRRKKHRKKKTLKHKRRARSRKKN
jgi:hypothetical protein